MTSADLSYAFMHLADAFYPFLVCLSFSVHTSHCFVHSVQLRLIIRWGHTKRPALHLDSDAFAEGGEEGELRGAEEIWVRLVAIMIV